MQKLTDKIFVWTDPDTIEEKAKEQLFNIAEMPFVFKHLAVMPEDERHVGGAHLRGG